jgi:hypothetical protein
MDEGKFWVDKEQGELVLESSEGEDRYYIEKELNYMKNRYLILIPSKDKEESDEAIVLKLIKEGDDEILSVIDDDEEFERVKDVYLNELED